ncbi:MAG: biotin/lipoyl-containing protein [Candidatus Methanomethylicia archaeon]
MSIEIKIPRLDEIQESAILVKWHKKEGDKVIKGEKVATIETLKTIFDIESPVNGIIEDVLVEEGKEVPVGTIICKIKSIE